MLVIGRGDRLSAPLARLIVAIMSILSSSCSTFCAGFFSFQEFCVRIVVSPLGQSIPHQCGVHKTSLLQMHRQDTLHGAISNKGVVQDEMRNDTTLLYNIMTFSLFFACRRPLPGVPAALPCGRHHVYIYHIVHSLLMHAYFDQLGIHPHPQHKLVQEDKQKLHLVQDTEV